MKSYKLELSKHAAKTLTEFRQTQPEVYRRLANALDEIEQNPLLGKPLKAQLKSRYSWRVGSYRIVYLIHHNQLLVLVIDISHRRDVYR